MGATAETVSCQSQRACDTLNPLSASAGSKEDDSGGGILAGVLVHEWLARRGGSENVFEEFVEMFPDADRFALWNDSDGRFAGVSETWLSKTPLRRSKALALPFMPLAWRRLPAVDADWVLISSHLFAHHARFRGKAADAPTFVYTHTPARYIWVPELDGRGDSFVARAVGTMLKPYDRDRAQLTDHLAANSSFVADRIARSWGRESEVIYPPVDVEAFEAPAALNAADGVLLAALPDQFLLGVSRFVPYKRLDAVIDAGRAADMDVVLAGSGPDEERLRRYADERHSGRVSFVANPSFQALKALYRAASAVVFAPIEDFGIVPVEAMASGTPVIANAVGGAAESVVHGRTGSLVETWDADSLRDAVEIALDSTPDDCVARARLFGEDVFRTRIRSWMTSHGVGLST